MTVTLALILGAAGGYVVGATPFGYLAGKLKGIDIREHGSKNIGATNVWRVMGRGFGLPVFLLDALKGWLPTWLALVWWTGQQASIELTTLGAMLTGFASVLGHNYTFWLSGRGGKGVATSAGVLLALAPLVIGIALVTWATLFFVTRYSSVASMGAAVAVPITMAVQMASSGAWNVILLGFGIVLCVLTIYRHKANIGRLMAGTELKVGRK
ncbi:MAG: glycerol-3-phosphate 1-O-acyltransferase PlsY [Verrucomicrobiaceae bacterium]|nr:glycerol-3-phosphate 1-O-acyltransferase PlsY [Verrucomicrobiaceae bacterium]